MATVETKTECPDCRSPMQPIKLIDEGHYQFHHELRYTAAESKRSCSGMYPVAGTVKATMCPSCGRIVLRGEPKAA